MSTFEDLYQPVMSFDEIAEEMGISQARVRFLYGRAIGKMRCEHYRVSRELVEMIEQQRSYARSVRAKRA